LDFLPVHSFKIYKREKPVPGILTNREKAVTPPSLKTWIYLSKRFSLRLPYRYILEEEPKNHSRLALEDSSAQGW
jgi:hypothetical protein